MRVTAGPGESAPAPGAVTARDRTTVVTSLVLLALAGAAWLHVVRTATGAMAGMDTAMTPGLRDGLVFVAGWTVMMTAMMLPSALPMIALYAATQRPAGAAARALAIAQFTLVYLGLWALSGAPAYVASIGVEAIASQALPYGLAVVLVVAGLFQLSPLKQVCLRNCRSPLGFLLGHWRPGWRGGLAMGWAHAVYCLGCCWALMVVLVAAGAMGLAWVLLIAALVAAEKLAPRGEWIARLTGIALVLLGLALAGRPELAAALRAAGHAM
jgi:predicted metal-binding membrane protein